METYTAILMAVAAVVVIGASLLFILVRASQADRAALSAEPADQPYPAEVVDSEAFDRAPVGTFVLLLGYIGIIAATWGYMYFLLWRRG
jgi:hypothetical protein